MHPNIWYPFTIIQKGPEPLKVTEGKGIWLKLEDGRKIMDCISSWWVNLHGHAHPYIARAISKQAEKLEQVIFANFTHDPAEQLAERLVRKLPGTLNKVFYSDDGSTAVEVGLKMAYQYWKNRGETRTSFICFEGAYHGDTFGAMSAGARSVFTELFKELLFDVRFLPFPETWINDDNVKNKEQQILNRLEDLFNEHPKRFAGVVIEPLVQGAGGMRMCRPEFLQELEKLCQVYNQLLIFDEVMTGFGRTGEWFACLKAGVTPDIICLAKGLTGGFLPLSVTVASDKIYNAFDSADPMKTFWHGHSYTANPLGCAAGLASFDLMIENEERFKGMDRWHREELGAFQNHPSIKHTRVTGTISAMDLDTGRSEGYLNEVADDIKKHCVEFGLLLRPLGNVLYLMPPYCITREELGIIYEQTGNLLEEVL